MSYIGNSPDQKVRRSTTVFSASDGQTVFTTAGYNVSQIDVYLNGVKLIDGVDYTATDGTTFTLTVGAELDDSVDAVYYNPVSLINEGFTKNESDARYAPISQSALVNSALQPNTSVSLADITTSGQLKGPATFVIDPAAHGDDTGVLIIKGDLQVDGTTTTINSTTVTINDLVFEVAANASNATEANGAGFVVGGSNASMTYDSASDSWVFNKTLTGTYSNLHPEVTVITTDINFNKPINTLTLTGNTTFTTSNLAVGKSCLFMMETSSNTPTFGAEVKWPDDTEPTWGDYPLWLITFICQTGSRVFATAIGYNT